MNTLPILFARDELGTIIQVALVLLFILGPVLFRVFGMSERQADRTSPRRPRPDPELDQQGTAVDEEVEEFLRRAETQRGGRPAPEVEVVEPGRRRALAARAVEPHVDMEIMGDESVADTHLSTRIHSSIDTSDIARDVDRLGDRVEQADDLMESHLRSSFDDRLGNISHRTSAPVTADVTPAPEEVASVSRESAAAAQAASRLAARLRSAQGMRDAIVLREILEPPDHRW